MGSKRLKSPINKNCQICNNIFEAWYSSTKTCSKQCKNKLASQITQKQFSSDDAKTNHRLLMKEVMATPEIRSRFIKGMSNRRSYKKENHPRWGVVLDDKTKQKIGDGNRGKFKGKTWDQMYGPEVANARRIENAEKMALTNAKLLNDRTSKTEKQLLRELSPLGYKQNQRVGKYTVDFLNETTRKVIEIYGDYWHCNPIKYKSDYYNHKLGMTAQEKWEYDEKRIKYLESLGYYVKVIWESEINEQHTYRNNKL